MVALADPSCDSTPYNLLRRVLERPLRSTSQKNNNNNNNNNHHHDHDDDDDDDDDDNNNNMVRASDSKSLIPRGVGSNPAGALERTLSPANAEVLAVNPTHTQVVSQAELC